VLEHGCTADNDELLPAIDKRRDGFEQAVLHEPVVAFALAHQPRHNPLD
jgi:hypothetical protein